MLLHILKWVRFFYINMVDGMVLDVNIVLTRNLYDEAGEFRGKRFDRRYPDAII